MRMMHLKKEMKPMDNYGNAEHNKTDDHAETRENDENVEKADVLAMLPMLTMIKNIENDEKLIK